MHLNIKPGAGLSYWGDVVVSVDGEGHWTVHQPEDPSTRAYIADFLNARYGANALVVQGGTVVDLIHHAKEELEE